MQGTADHWVVRCPPAKTLNLCEELRALGFEVWTPSVERQYRKSRSKKYIRVTEPMLSSFLFVAVGPHPQRCAERLDDLRFLYGIRVMRNAGAYAGVRDEDLAGLRSTETEAATFGIDNVVKPDNFEIGQKGSISASAFMGVTCTLVDRTRNNLLVLLDGATTPITIKAALFCPIK